jgi:hypothetical protein
MCQTNFELFNKLYRCTLHIPKGLNSSMALSFKHWTLVTCYVPDHNQNEANK